MRTSVKIISIFFVVVVIGFIISIFVPPKSHKPVAQNDLSQVYSNSVDGFSIRIPSDYIVDESYSYQERGPGTDIPGIKFTIATSTATGTNLGTDSYVSVEEIPQANLPAGGCNASLFLEYTTASSTVIDAGTTYSVASFTGAAAGNRYEEMVYALPGTNPCIAVRYLIHYGVIENYPAGTIKQFDETALVSQFDSIRRTLIVTQ